MKNRGSRKILSYLYETDLRSIFNDHDHNRCRTGKK